jgi:serine/threonine protein kinase
MKIDDPRHVHAYFENLVIASLLVPNFKDDGTIRLFLKQFGEVAEQHAAQPLGFTLQTLLAEAKKNIDEPATLLEKFDANLATLARITDPVLKKQFFDTLQAALDSGMEDACTKSRLLEPAQQLFTASPGGAVTRIAQPGQAGAATRIAQPAQAGPAAATVLAQPGATQIAPQARTQVATEAAGATRVAPAAGASQKKAEYLNALPSGYQIHEYVVDKVLGVGGFGITYLGRDTTLNLRVAIKEYLPNELAVRDAALNVLPKSSDCEETYYWGLDRFLQEARLLARFNHPNIVRVLRFFEANGTAYMMMQYEDGESLDEKLKKLGAPDEAWLQGILFPLLDGLKVMHDEGFLHRDIKPGNIYIRRSDGSPVLLDFGAARAQMRGKDQNMTAIVTPGYAPFEQYFTDGCQGPWSDIYAFGAVIYKAITGKAPPEAASRVKKDTMVTASEAGKGRYSDKFLRAVDWALQSDEKKRPQTIEDWQRALTSLNPHDGTKPVGGLQAGAGEATRTLAVQGRSAAVSSPKTTFSQLRSGDVDDYPEVSVFREEERRRSRAGMLTWLLFLTGLAGGGAYLSQDEALVREWAFKAADTAWEHELYSVSLPIYEYYDQPGDQQTPMRIGVLFEEGKHISADKKTAFLWYGKAAERGNPVAALKLAQMLERGDGVDMDVGTAVEWYRKAAAGGQVEAQFRLGIAYLRKDNLNLEADRSESAKWLGHAAAQGHQKARELVRLLR